MTWTAAQARIDVIADLKEIRRMYDNLHDQAAHHAHDKDIPGGRATILLGPGVDFEAWNYVQLSATVGRLTIGYKDTPQHKRDIELAAITTTELEPPLSFLASWVDKIREARGQAPSNRRATINREIDYLEKAIDWLTATNDDGTPWWTPIDEFATGLARTRRTLENVLHDGERSDRIQAECSNCDEHERLVTKHGKTKRLDFWQCPNCHHAYDTDGVARCFRQMLVRRGDAPEWITINAAASALGRSPDTIRRWTRNVNDLGQLVTPKIASRRTELGIEVNWPEARTFDLKAKRRGKYRVLA